MYTYIFGGERATHRMPTHDGAAAEALPSNVGSSGMRCFRMWGFEILV